MLKTKKQLYEEIHDSLRGRILGLEIDLIISSKQKQDVVLGAETVNGPMGPSVRNITIKDRVMKQKGALEQLKQVLEITKIKLKEVDKIKD